MFDEDQSFALMEDANSNDEEGSDIIEDVEEKPLVYSNNDTPLLLKLVEAQSHRGHSVEGCKDTRVDYGKHILTTKSNEMPYNESLDEMGETELLSCVVKRSGGKLRHKQMLFLPLLCDRTTYALKGVMNPEGGLLILTKT
ncbi:hypothetical protein CALCODRAFT_512833 [Calocera cornea HHB12733]|uniref:Uncharacterized protein n=1 Tax=Calocera cornea HHB12733 TaxID=1353952 RepID=A0A165CQT9_9BASI|nr:hypothetical protein CALCODRAFT_512833 [Calocera cornea HHB12733]